ncbi:unnamed protein product [Agarophyton chilense]|eukprot:gb/GEZJ01001736.1/.p2 GENE.gb/GEZJ01001736.1/~~gb/GEZJ01001736.1/.p2  ORF type:complete len:367 (-),score=42.23 gb/GEZJ01001736.1/:1308-2408(-)
MQPQISSRSLTASLVSLNLDAAKHTFQNNGNADRDTPPCTPPLSPPSPQPQPPSNSLPSTSLTSHVRAHSSHTTKHSSAPLVRLLDDISTVSHSISSYVSQHHHDDSSPVLDTSVATTRLYHALCHDGYACVILAKNDTPFTFSDSAVHGPYVVMLTPLDIDPCEQHLLCGTSFSVYTRASPPSVSGTRLDLQQRLAHQMAAGYILYASATTLTYTMGNGAFSFYLHPVATQYFLQTTKPVKFSTGNDMYCEYAKLRHDENLGSVAKKLTNRLGGRIFDTGCFIADFDAAVRTGGIVLWYDIHLMCEAAPMALLSEQMGGRAIDANCKRILDLAVEDFHVHKTVTFLAGPAHIVDSIQSQLTPQLS